MNEYKPSNWVVIKTVDTYKILAGWSGGYLTSDSWRINSGIMSIYDDQEYFYFTGFNGSVYKCHKSGYGLRTNTQFVWEALKSQCTLMNEETDWLNFDWKV